MNITDRIRDRASDAPDAVAFVRYRAGPVSYSDFDRTIDCVGSNLVASGVEPGATVVVEVVPSFANLMSILAIVRIGAVPAPDSFLLDPNAVRLIDPEATARFPGRTLLFDRAWLDRPAPGIGRITQGGGADTAIIHASSGTTQRSKHVAISHDCVDRRVEVLDRALPLPPDPKVLCLLRPISCYGFDTTLRALGSGATLMLATTIDNALAAISRFGANHVALNPFWIERLLDAAPPGARPFPSLARLESAGSHLARQRYAVARERLCPDIWNHYGSTEMGLIAAAPMSALEGKPDAVGYAPSGVEIEAVDDVGAPLPAGARGRLRVRGAGIASGYLDAMGATDDAFGDGWYRTADVGAVDHDGLVSLHGRLGELMNVGGYKVSPRAVEDALLAIDGVREASAFGVPDPETGVTQIWAAVVVEPPLTSASLVPAVKARLTTFAPRYLVAVPAIPRNAAGKVMREMLIASATASLSRAPG
jgi:acyl-coenzyme A synthetase/AMP-(fatty) acid ligase